MNDNPLNLRTANAKNHIYGKYGYENVITKMIGENDIGAIKIFFQSTMKSHCDCMLMLIPYSSIELINNIMSEYPQIMNNSNGTTLLYSLFSLTDDVEILNYFFEEFEKKNKIGNNMKIHLFIYVKYEKGLDYLIDKFQFNINKKFSGYDSLIDYYFVHNKKEFVKHLIKKYSATVNIDKCMDHLASRYLLGENLFLKQLIEKLNLWCDLVNDGLIIWDYSKGMFRLFTYVVLSSVYSDAYMIDFIDFYIENVRIDTIIVQSLILMITNKKIIKSLERYLEMLTKN
jgi:hypothetical protein